MARGIDDFVSMGDIDSLYEIMVEDDDWMNQLDAAEGLVKLLDKRGLEFLLSAEHSEDRRVCEVVKEILTTPEIARKMENIRAEEEDRRAKKVEIARKRLSRGKKVFCYK